ncbi:hypothetical protein GH714_030511 [Hevea brasiliensis]|uniref:Uncharacterized protein n=1 Tax=Hevea brasiliensis TaxID=3981 RepID=A0A6A6LV37_HEVBR|nr:hypothetical protein GH714_030511 [Hevea brasiliensis]
MHGRLPCGRFDNPNYFTLVLHVKGTKGEWGYYDGRVPGKDYREGLNPLGCDNDVLTMCQHAELEGSINVYVKHLRVNDLKREFSREIDAMQNKGKGVVIKEIDEDANNAVPENNVQDENINDSELDNGEASKVTTTYLINNGEFGILSQQHIDEIELGTMYDEAVGNGYDKGRVEEGDCNDNSTGPIDPHKVRVEEANHSVQKQRRLKLI